MSTEDYLPKYQHILEPTRSRPTNSETRTVSKSTIEVDILAFDHIIKQSKANIRNAQCTLVLLVRLVFPLLDLLFSDAAGDFPEYSTLVALQRD